MEITFKRAIKIWWSFIWRAWVSSLPLMIILFPLIHWLIPFSKPGQAPMPLKPGQIDGFFGKMFFLWIISVTTMIFLQAVAIRWLLKTTWSDFKLIAVPIVQENSSQSDVRPS